MRWLGVLLVCVLGWPDIGLAQTDPFCALNCRAANPGLAGLRYEACRALVCTADPSVGGPAWQSGRIGGPDHGGFAAVSSDDFSQQLILTCQSRGPISLGLRSATIDRGEVQVVVDGQGVEWLTLEQRDGLLVSEVPRVSRLIFALQDGNSVTLLSQDGRAQSRFGLRGSDRAISRAMDYCAEQ